MELSFEKAPNMSPRGGVTFYVNGIPEEFTLTHRTILTWEKEHGGLYHWYNKTIHENYVPTFAEVRDIIIGSHLADDKSEGSKEETRKLLRYIGEYSPEHFLLLHNVASIIVSRAFMPEVSLDEDEPEFIEDKKK